VTLATIPFTLTRLGRVMSPRAGEPLEAEGVLNPGSGRTPDGRLHLLPRLVAAANVSRVGLAEVVVRDGAPVGVERRGAVLAPDEGWERGTGHAGVEDPRVTWVPSLGLHVMTYVAYGPLGRSRRSQCRRT
jgi:beta-1,2-mannobiose phosphorylase / 1,2-beta-oligomannan phosphorylase